MSVVFALEAPYRGRYELQRLTFGSGGPTVALVAGLHGNEVNGTHALNLVANVLRMQRPRGTVHLLPCVNTLGADEARKRWPFDDRDIAAAFPGDPTGGPVERIAAAVMSATEADVCLDVHSGGAHTHEHPHARAPLSGASLDHARALGLPVTWRRTDDALDDGLLGAWRAAGRSAIQVRGGRGASLDTDDAHAIARGIVRLLDSLGLLAGADAPAHTFDTDRVTDYRSGCGGFFVPAVAPGARVAARTLLGVIRTPLGGEPIEEVRAERAGLVMALRTYPMVHARELVVRIAEGPT